MKCVQDPETKRIHRVSDRIAFIRVERGWSYVSKARWKLQDEPSWLQKKLAQLRGEE